MGMRLLRLRECNYFCLNAAHNHVCIIMCPTFFCANRYVLWSTQFLTGTLPPHIHSRKTQVFVDTAVALPYVHRAHLITTRPGGRQLFVACSTGEPGMFPQFCVLFNQLHVHHLVCMTVAPRQLDTCGKIPRTCALLAVLSPSSPTRKHSRPFAFFRATENGVRAWG